jgi:hypothetical protein
VTGAKKKEEEKMKRVTVLLAAGLILLAAASLPTFRAGAQETVVTDDNLDQALASAKTPADHEAIAAYYDKEAASNAAKAKLHHAVHHNYDKFRIKPPDMGHHCDELAKFFQRAADQDKDLAAGHRKMAKNLSP